jgi:hypothetical protein
MELLQAKKLAIDNMYFHGLLDEGWNFEFDTAKRRFGCCNYTKKRISLSAPLTLLRDEQFVKNTILHEIAHALVGYKHGHGKVWKAKAKELGCNAERCSSDVRIQGNVKGVCPNGHEVFKHRMPKREQSCGRCSNKFERNFLMTYERNK